MQSMFSNSLLGSASRQHKVPTFQRRAEEVKGEGALRQPPLCRLQ
jgi:hypothetical protein